jgi:segregation and condensation protein B
MDNEERDETIEKDISAVVSSESIDDIDSEKEIQNIKKVEAALFIAGRFLSLKELVSLTDINPIFLRKILDDLNDKYKDSGIEIVRKEDMWKMDVAQEHVNIVNKLASGTSEFTRAEQETLAIIAYKQPIKQSVVVKIRGNKAYDHIKNFVSLGLINKKKTGHTSELTLKEEFYDYFHVKNDMK